MLSIAERHRRLQGGVSALTLPKPWEILAQQRADLDTEPAPDDQALPVESDVEGVA